MRCDWPVGYDEDCIEPPCEIFFQLFIGNAETAANDVPNNTDNNSMLDAIHEAINNSSNQGPFFVDSDGFTDDSDEDDNNTLLSYYHEHISTHYANYTFHNTASDASILSSSGDSSSDEGEAELEEPQCEEMNNIEHCVQNSPSGMSQYYEESLLPENIPSGESEHKEDVIEESKVAGESSSAVNIRASENCNDTETPDVSCEEIGNCEVSSNELPLSSDMPHLQELATIELGTSSGNSGSQPSTYVSLYVVVPPTNFSNESSRDSLPGVSSDRLFSSLTPLNPPCSPASVISDSETSELSHLQNSSKVSNDLEESTSDTSASYNATSTTENKKYCLSEFNSVLDNLNSVISDSKSETSFSLNNDMHPGFPICGTNSSEENGIVLENNTNNEILSVPSLKRKVCSSTDDSVVNKVPKCNLSQTSNDSLNHGSPDNHSEILSNNSEKQTSHEENEIDLVPSLIAGENSILTSGKAFDGTSDVNQKPKNH